MLDGGLSLPREPVQAEVRLGPDVAGERRMVRKGFRPEEIILRPWGADVRSGKASR